MSCQCYSSINHNHTVRIRALIIVLSGSDGQLVVTERILEGCNVELQNEAR